MRGFVKHFNVKALKKEVKRVRDVIKHVDNVTPESLQRAYNIITRIDLGVVPAKSLNTSSDEIIRNFGAVKVMRDNAEWHYAWGNVFRQRVMLCERHMAIMFTERLTTIARETMSQSTRPPAIEQDAFTRILVRIETNLQCGMDIRLDSSTYIPDVLKGVEFYAKAQKRIFLDAELPEHVAKMAVRVMRKWFGLEDDNITAARADFISILLDNYGPGALLLPHVWNAYVNMPSWTCNLEVSSQGRTRNKFTATQHSTLRAEISKSKPANHQTDAFIKIHQLKIAYRDLVDHVHESLAMAQKPSVPKKRKSRIIEDGYELDVEAAGGPTPVHGDVASAPRKVATLLRAAADIDIDNSNPSSNLQRAISRNTDMMQPLRERAVSRSRINGRNGQQLTRSHGSTMAGLFSLFVFRNILYNSTYLHSTTIGRTEQRVLFENPDDFIRHTQTFSKAHRVKQPEAYFCNQKALSRQTIKGRKTKNAAKFWTLAASCEVEALANAPARFEDMRKKIEKEANADKVPGFGKLSRYLTLADMCMTGLVEMPSDEEVGTCIYRLKAGGAKGLELLGYLDNAAEKHTEAEVRTAFQEYYRAVSRELEPDERESMGWNPIVGEHTLCKVKRLWDKLV